MIYTLNASGEKTPIYEHRFVCECPSCGTMVDTFLIEDIEDSFGNLKFSVETVFCDKCRERMVSRTSLTVDEIVSSFRADGMTSKDICDVFKKLCDLKNELEAQK